MSSSRFLRSCLAAVCICLPFSAQSEEPENIRIGLAHQVAASESRVTLGAQLGFTGNVADNSTLLQLSETLKPCRAPGHIVDIGGVPIPDQETFKELIRLSALLTGNAQITCEIGAERAAVLVNPVIEIQDATGDWRVNAQPSPDVLSSLLVSSMATAADYGMNMGEWRTDDGPGKVVFLEDSRETSAYEVRDDQFVGTLFGADAEEQQLLIEIAEAMGHEPRTTTGADQEDFPVEITFSAVDPFTYFGDLRIHLANLFAIRFVHSNYRMIATSHDLDRMAGKSNGPEPTRQQILEEALSNFEKLAQLAK